MSPTHTKGVRQGPTFEAINRLVVQAAVKLALERGSKRWVDELVPAAPGSAG
jgi:hypothetical protein